MPVFCSLMGLEPAEITALAEALAPRLAELLARRFEERPEWAFTIPEAASWARVEPYAIRAAIPLGGR